MLLPYTHTAAMAQSPVPYRFADRVIWLYPIRQGDAINFDVWLKYEYAQQFAGKIELLPQSDRPAFIDSVLDSVEQFSYQFGEGRSFLLSSVDALVKLLLILTRDEWQDVREDMFPDNEISTRAIHTIDEMLMAVYRPIPPVPPQPANQKRREYTEEESVVKIYRALGEKYHLPFQQVLELTPYQVFWYL